MTEKYAKTLTGNPDLLNAGFDFPPENPFALLKYWFEQANTLHIVESHAMTLSTVNADHRPSSRVVLITSIENGIFFGTREDSRKGVEIKNNPYCAGNLYWRETLSQINFQGKITQLSDEISDQEFAKRVIEAQAVTACCIPSKPLQDESLLRNEIKNLLQKNCKIERPVQWHVYRIDIFNIEFWIGSQDRFHKRLRYDLVNDSWQHHKLQP